MRSYILLFTLFFIVQLTAQENKTEVLTLGTFHFNFPNKDFVKTDSRDQIDVLEPKYQEEIQLIIERLKKFNPTVIIIERPSSKQKEIDSLYNLYLEGKYELKRDESQQIGFRLAKESNVSKLYCVDEWGEFNRQVDQVISGNDTIEKRKFSEYYQQDPEAFKKYNPDPIFKNEGILAELIRVNKSENISRSLGNYLIGPFKYESEKGDFFGVNFQTGRWFNRNLKIFRNIQRIPLNSDDRILVIFGAGHMNILNLLFESSPEFELVEANKFLQ